jgi:hypothetical protein
VPRLVVTGLSLFCGEDFSRGFRYVGEPFLCIRMEYHCDILSFGGYFLEGECVQSFFFEGYKLGDFREGFNF